jgi:hypothetical protein
VHPPTYNVWSGATSIRRIPFASPQSFRLVDGGQRAHSRERTGRLRHARYVQRKRNSGSPKGCEPYGDGVPVVVAVVTHCQGEREGRSQGQVAQVSTIYQERRGTRDAESRSLAGDHPRIGIGHWRATCGENRMRRSAGGRRKGSASAETSPAAYPAGPASRQ